MAKKAVAKAKPGKALNKTQHQYLIDRLEEAAQKLEGGIDPDVSAMFGRMRDYINENPDADLYDFVVWMCLNADDFVR